MPTKNYARLNRQNKVGTKSTDKRILIVCEGTRTEPNYFSGFQKELRTIVRTKFNRQRKIGI
jgi:hypothetical protein